MTTWAKGIRKAGDLLVYLSDHWTELSQIYCLGESKVYCLRSLISPGERTFSFPLFITKPSVFKDTKRWGYSLKYSLRSPGKYYHFKCCVKCSSITEGAPCGVILDFEEEEIVFTNLPEALKNPTLSRAVRGGLEELVRKWAIKMLMWTTFYFLTGWGSI